MRNHKKSRHVFLLFTPALIFLVLMIPVELWLLKEINYAKAGNPFPALLFFGALFLLGIGCIVYLCLCRITMDSEGIHSRIPGSKYGNGMIRWENVRAVGIFRTGGGERLLFVSTIPRVWAVRNIMRNDWPLDQLIKLGYSKRRLDLIKQFYDGEIVTL